MSVMPKCPDGIGEYVLTDECIGMFPQMVFRDTNDFVEILRFDDHCYKDPKITCINAKDWAVWKHSVLAFHSAEDSSDAAMSALMDKVYNTAKEHNVSKIFYATSRLPWVGKLETDECYFASCETLMFRKCNAPDDKYCIIIGDLNRGQALFRGYYD